MALAVFLSTYIRQCFQGPVVEVCPEHVLEGPWHGHRVLEDALQVKMMKVQIPYMGWSLDSRLQIDFPFPEIC